MARELPEPYASMSALDPRRREYIERRDAEVARLAGIETYVEQLREAWNRGHPRTHLAVPTLVTSASVDLAEPVRFTVTVDLARVLAEVELVGWEIDQVQYVCVPGAETPLAAGVRLPRATVLAMVSARRPRA